MQTITEHNCVTCDLSVFHAGLPATDYEPAEEGEYECIIGFPGALEQEAWIMPDCSEYVLDPDLTDD